MLRCKYTLWPSSVESSGIIHCKLEFAFLWPQGTYGLGRDTVGERKWEGVGQV